jgi:competence protein ComEA
MIKHISKYFTLNRRERNGIITVMSLVFVLLIVKCCMVYSYAPPVAPPVVVELDDLAARLAEETKNQRTEINSTTSTVKKDSLFYFDPNSISYEQAVQLGFENRIAHILLKYRSKGGKFYKTNDLKKLYGMSDVLFDKLKPFIVLRKEHVDTANYKPREYKSKFISKPKQQITLEINSADSLQWLELKGIGPGYTKMILKYKKLLGGFYKMEQLKEVYHFSDSLYNSIKENLTVNPAFIQKLKVNSVDFKTLVHHPYIKYEGTKCIFALKHDKKITAQDLINSSCFSREQLEKVLVYLDFD